MCQPNLLWINQCIAIQWPSILFCSLLKGEVYIEHFLQTWLFAFSSSIVFYLSLGNPFNRASIINLRKIRALEFLLTRLQSFNLAPSSFSSSSSSLPSPLSFSSLSSWCLSSTSHHLTTHTHTLLLWIIIFTEDRSEIHSTIVWIPNMRNLKKAGNRKWNQWGLWPTLVRRCEGHGQPPSHRTRAPCPLRICNKMPWFCCQLKCQHWWWDHNYWTEMMAPKW